MTEHQNREEQEKTHSGWRAWLIQLLVSFVLVGAILGLNGIPEGKADRVRAVDDAFTVIALLYLCVGSLLWVSTTGFFDIFGFAIRRALHALIPGMGGQPLGDYYEYREGRRQKRRSHSLKSTFFAGLFLLLVSIILTFVWYGMQ